jgi:hypothetical protein
MRVFRLPKDPDRKSLLCGRCVHRSFIPFRASRYTRERPKADANSSTPEGGRKLVNAEADAFLIEEWPGTLQEDVRVAVTTRVNLPSRYRKP